MGFAVETKRTTKLSELWQIFTKWLKKIFLEVNENDNKRTPKAPKRLHSLG